MKSEFPGIDNLTLDKIHLLTCRIIKEREKKNQLEGKGKPLLLKLSFWSQISDTIAACKFLAELFEESRAFEPGQKDNMTGLKIYAEALKRFPLESCRYIEIRLAQEIQRRREMRRKRLDAGNIEKLARLSCQD